MMRLQTYAGLSLVATLVVIYHAFHRRGQFYPAMVHLSSSKISLVLLLNMGLVFMCILWQFTKRLFLGSLREAEVERLNEQSWREVMEILFAITIFRQDFSVTFLAMVTAVLLIKALHWLAQKRVEYIETTPSVPMLSHIRIVSFMGFLLFLDSLFLYNSVSYLIQTRQASVSLFFSFEYMILAVDFKSAATGVSAKAMRNELNAMIQKIDDPEYRKAFEAEMQSFFILFNRYLSERAKGQKIDWEKIEPPTKEQIVPYADLAKDADPALLDKLAVLKLNGGLGTTMGCVGPKSVIEVREGMTFLDLSVRQIEHLNSAHNVNVPFILMNSFNTDEDTARIIQKYANHRIELMTFNQSRYPRVNKETLLPTPKSALEDKAAWYPPGHGDLFDAIMNSGLVDKLLSQGKEYLFVSNVDNLGAVVDLPILEHMHKTGAEYLLEVTDKTKSDVKGGTLINYEGGIRLLEVAQVPNDHLPDFASVRKFKIFNTNNLWINLRAIKRIMENDGMDLSVIVNHKVSDKGEAVIQLETAVGDSIKHFKGAHGINVPRSRFLPVKSCSDLLLLMSNMYRLEHGTLVMNPDRMFLSTPVIKLGDQFKKVAQFQKRFKTIPNLLELDHLTVAGDVSFGRNTVLRGTVIIVANDGQRIELPDGATLENKLVSGNLVLTDH